MRRITALLLALATFAIAGPTAALPRTLNVVVPDPDNLQYVSFWLANALGFFAEEDIAVTIRSPETPKEAIALVQHGEADVFVLPPPMALDLIAEGYPLVLVANLLRNDPIELVARESIVRERGIPTSGSIAERLRAMKGLRVGVAPGPPPRLHALFAAYGLDADKDITIVTLPGKTQNDAFAADKVDALYAHTPYLEKALLDQGAVIVVNQSSGEVPALATRQIHTLGVTTRLRASMPDVVLGFVRAIVHAERRAHADPAGCVEALLRAFPKMKRPNVELFMKLYEPAIPTSAAVSVEGLRSALPLFPASKSAPDVAGIDLAAHVDDSFVTKIERDEPALGRDPRASQQTTRLEGRGMITPGRAILAVTLTALVTALVVGIGVRRRKRHRDTT